MLSWKGPLRIIESKPLAPHMTTQIILVICLEAISFLLENQLPSMYFLL